MASKKAHSGGPGTYSSHGVRGTMDAPFKAGLNKGTDKGMTGTFGQKRDGASELPTSVEVSLGKRGTAPKVSDVNSAKANQTAKRPGTSGMGTRDY